MKFPITKFAITIFVFLAYVAIITQAMAVDTRDIGDIDIRDVKPAWEYIIGFESEHAKIMEELGHRMAKFKKRMLKYHNAKAPV